MIIYMTDQTVTPAARIEHLRAVATEVDRLAAEVIEPWLAHFDASPDGQLTARLLRRNMAQLYTTTEALRQTIYHVRNGGFGPTAA